MQNQRRYSLVRRILFPYSGEEPLSPKQGMRVILAWTLLIPLLMSLCTLAIGAIVGFTLYKTVLLLLFSFLSGAFIFGLLGWIVVRMSNRAAHIHQQRQVRAANR